MPVELPLKRLVTCALLPGVDGVKSTCLPHQPAEPRQTPAGRGGGQCEHVTNASARVAIFATIPSCQPIPVAVDWRCWETDCVS